MFTLQYNVLLVTVYGLLPFKAGQGPETQSVQTHETHSKNELTPIGLHLSKHSRPSQASGLTIGNNQPQSTGSERADRATANCSIDIN